MEKVNIEVQYFHGCPHAGEMLENVKNAIIGFENTVNYSERIVDTPKKAEEADFRGSPTLLINGIDFYFMPIPERPAFSCRFYPKGLPTISAIRDRIILLSQT